MFLSDSRVRETRSDSIFAKDLRLAPLSATYWDHLTIFPQNPEFAEASALQIVKWY